MFAKAGAQVIVNGQDIDKGERVVAEILDSGGDAIFIPCDVGDIDALAGLVQESVDHYGKLQIFWHNAGDAGPGRIDSVTEKAYDETMGVHLKAGFFGCQYAIPHLLEHAPSVILFTGSGAAFKPLPGSPTYSIVKAGLVMLARSLAVHLGPQGVRVNCICPGPTDTPLRDAVFARHPELADPRALSEANIEATPLRRVGQPDEIARVALFLVSDDASYVTGESLLVDGGLVAGAPADWLRIPA